MKDRRSRGLAFGLVGAFSLALIATVGASAFAAATPRHGGHLTAGTESDWHPLDPLTAYAISDAAVQNPIYDTLLRHTADGQIKPDLAKSYDVSSDGLTYTLHLRHGVKFQDGTPFNAKAVKFNFDRDLNKQGHCACGAFFAPIKSAEVKGPYTVAIHLKERYAALPSVLATVYGEMVSPAAVKKYGKAYPRHPVGTGPFKYVGGVPGQIANYVRWKGYWRKGEPYLDKVTIKAMPNTQSRYASVQSGAIQVAENVGYRQVLDAKSNPNVKVMHEHGLGTLFVMMQVAKPPFNSLKARRALTYATNFEAINKGVFRDLYTTGVESPFPKASWAYPGKHVPGYAAYDLSKAKKLVKELGGLSFSISTEENPAAVQLVQALQSEWAQAGIKVTINQVDQATLINDASQGKFQAMLFRWRGSYDPDGNVYPFFYCHARFNNIKVCNKHLDKLLDEGRHTLKRSERKRIYAKVAQVIAKQSYYDFLYVADWWRVMSPKVHGIPGRPNNWLILRKAWLSK